MAFLKTHITGIRKYQWVTIPLALHGVVAKEDGSVVDITIGEDDCDPVFYINDLLPHLGQEQGKKPLNEAIPGESLNLLSGSRKGNCDSIRDNVMKLLMKNTALPRTIFFPQSFAAFRQEKHAISVLTAQ